MSSVGLKTRWVDYLIILYIYNDTYTITLHEPNGMYHLKTSFIFGHAKGNISQE